jgi:hypothetical protein
MADAQCGMEKRMVVTAFAAPTLRPATIYIRCMKHGMEPPIIAGYRVKSAIEIPVSVTEIPVSASKNRLRGAKMVKKGIPEPKPAKAGCRPGTAKDFSHRCTQMKHRFLTADKR